MDGRQSIIHNRRKRNMRQPLTHADLTVTPLPDRVAGFIRDGIMRRTWNPGDQIIESRLAKQLGVGQHVVREALQHLEFEGYVRKIPNRGNFVTRLSRHDVAQAFDFRMELEPLAVRLSCNRWRPSDEDLPGVIAILDEMENAARAGDYARFQSADFSFHAALWDLAGDPHVSRALHMCVRPLFAFALLRLSGETLLDLKAVAQQHREWFLFLRSASAEDAAQRTREAIASFREQVLDSWNE